MVLITQSENLKPLLICFTILALQPFTGIGAVMFFGVTLLQETGSVIDPYHANIVIGVIRIICALLSVPVLRTNISRKHLYAGCNFICGIATGMLGLAIIFNWPPWTHSLCLIGFIVPLGFGTTMPWLWIAEFFRRKFIYKFHHLQLSHKSNLRRM